MHLLLSAAFAQDGWEVSRTSGGCEYRRGPIEADGNSPLWTRCTWPSVSAEAVEGLISAYGDHDSTWESIAVCDEVERSEEQVRVHHVHAIPGLSDREIELTWTWATEDDGATRHEWVRSAVQPPVDSAHVNPTRDEGYYRVRALDEGVEVEALFYYDPAGNIPDWLVRATQVSSADLMMQELRQAARRAD